MYNQPDLAKRQSQSADAGRKLLETFHARAAGHAARPGNGTQAKANGS